MKIFAVSGDLNSPLLVDDTYWVINGAYQCKLNKDGNLTIPYSNLVATFVMDVPAKIARSGDYNKIIYECEKIYQGRKNAGN